jgi:hypothetical protein
VSEPTFAAAPQPPPIARPGGDVQSLVIADLHERRQAGIAKYGTPLQAHNGRDALVDAYQESLDLACYLRQVIEERQGGGSLGVLLNDFRLWAKVTFPHSTPGSCVAHLAREVEELRANPTDPGEIADVIFLAVDAAQRAGLDLEQLLAAKLAKCKSRKWGESDAEGVVEHIRDGAVEYRRGFDHATGTTILEQHGEHGGER